MSLLPQCRSHVTDQHLARGREDQLSRQAQKQRRPEIILEGQDLPIDGGRRHIEPVRRLPDGTRPGHLVQIGQQTAMQHRGSAVRALPKRQRQALKSML